MVGQTLIWVNFVTPLDTIKHKLGSKPEIRGQLIFFQQLL